MIERYSKISHIYWLHLTGSNTTTERVYGHGWILPSDEKMSKGNILDPIEIVNKYGLTH